MWLGTALLVSFLRRETRRRFLAGSVVDHVPSDQANEVSFRRKVRVFRVAGEAFCFLDPCGLTVEWATHPFGSVGFAAHRENGEFVKNFRED